MIIYRNKRWFLKDGTKLDRDCSECGEPVYGMQWPGQAEDSEQLPMCWLTVCKIHFDEQIKWGSSSPFKALLKNK